MTFFQVNQQVDWLHQRHEDWSAIKTIIKIRSEPHENNRLETECRYYLSSRDLTAESTLNSSRLHWGIENGNHLILDVIFGEDKSQIGQGNAPENIGTIGRIALNLLKTMKSAYKRVSYKRMRRLAGWNTDFLYEIFSANFMR